MNSLTSLQNYQPISKPIILNHIHVLRGANYFSSDPVIRFRISLQEYDEVFTNEIQGFYEKLKHYLPSLYEHHCSVGQQGGFFQRVEEGTLLGHVMEHVAIEFQELAGMHVGFGKTRMTKIQGDYNVVFRFEDEIAGVYAGKSALSLINSILQNLEFDVHEIVNNLIFIREKQVLGFNTQAIVNEAKRRRIKTIRLDKYNLVQLGSGKYRKIIRATITGNTSLIAVETAENKYLTNQILFEEGIPVPETKIIFNHQQAIDFKNSFNENIVIKPIRGNHGFGVYLPENDIEIEKAIQIASKFDDVIAQQFIKGKTFRLLTINYQFVAASLLTSPFVVGDGKSSVNELINNLNAAPEREKGDRGKLSVVEIDENTEQILSVKNLTSESILPEGKVLILKNTGSLSVGAISENVTEQVHPYNQYVAERISKILNLDVAGIDIITEDISLPVIENDGKIIEVNAAPDFKMHISPNLGQPIEVQKNFVEMLFPEGSRSNIPLYSVTGSYGKDLAVRILSHWLSFNHQKIGIVGNDGLYISQHCIKSGETIDSQNTEIILKDSTIDCILVETPIETILEYGIGYRFADFGIVLNLDDTIEKYFKYDHIFDIEDVAYAKSVVAEEVYDEGYAILNADNELILNMKNRLYCNFAVFSKSYQNPEVRQIVDSGGIACILDNYRIVMYSPEKTFSITDIRDIPMYQQKKSDYLIDSILASTLVMFLSGTDERQIAEILNSIPVF